MKIVPLRKLWTRSIEWSILIGELRENFGRIEPTREESVQVSCHKTKARTMVGRGEKSLLSDPGSE